MHHVHLSQRLVHPYFNQLLSFMFLIRQIFHMMIRPLICLTDRANQLCNPDNTRKNGIDSSRKTDSNDSIVVSEKQTVKYTDNQDISLISGSIPCLKNSGMMQWKNEHTLNTKHTHNLKLSERRPVHTLYRAEAEVMTLVEGQYLCSRDALIFYGEILGGACM